MRYTLILTHFESFLKTRIRRFPSFYSPQTYQVEFSKSTNGLKSNEDDPIGKFGGTVPLAHGDDMDAIRRYFDSFYYSKGYYILKIDTTKLPKVLWRNHSNTKNGEFFSVVPPEAIVSLSVWTSVGNRESKIENVAEDIPYQWAQESNLIAMPELLYKKIPKKIRQCSAVFNKAI